MGSHALWWPAHAVGQAARPQHSRDRALLANADVPAIAVFAGFDPGFQQRSLAARECCHADSQRRVTRCGSKSALRSSPAVLLGLERNLIFVLKKSEALGERIILQTSALAVDRQLRGAADAHRQSPPAPSVRPAPSAAQKYAACSSAGLGD